MATIRRRLPWSSSSRMKVVDLGVEIGPRSCSVGESMRAAVHGCSADASGGARGARASASCTMIGDGQTWMMGGYHCLDSNAAKFGWVSGQSYHRRGRG